jgi:uncharacterized membrane protein YqjE
LAANPTHVDPDAGIPDLVRQLGDDARQLVANEARLAKLEMRESMHQATRGAVWMGVAFAVGIVALVAFTIMLAALIGRVTGSYWVGALVTGVVELVAAAVLVKRGVSTIGSASLTMPETRSGAVTIVKGHGTG